jgi:hypothetical protein
MTPSSSCVASGMSGPSACAVRAHVRDGAMRPGTGARCRQATVRVSLIRMTAGSGRAAARQAAISIRRTACSLSAREWRMSPSLTLSGSYGSPR